MKYFFRKPFSYCNLLLNISQVELAQRPGTAFRTISEIINKKRGIMPEKALKLARYFGTSKELCSTIYI